MATIDSTNLVVRVTRRLFITLFTLFTAVLVFVALTSGSKLVVLPEIVIATGVIGGFVGLQRRLRDLTVSDLQLIADSWIYTCLSPMVGGILALLLLVLFVSGLLSGQLFPNFVADKMSPAIGFSSLFALQCEHYQDYAKLVFWSFIAGFSERFVTDVISRFEGTAIKQFPETADVVPSAGA